MSFSPWKKGKMEKKSIIQLSWSGWTEKIWCEKFQPEHLLILRRNLYADNYSSRPTRQWNLFLRESSHLDLLSMKLTRIIISFENTLWKQIVMRIIDMYNDFTKFCNHSCNRRKNGVRKLWNFSLSFTMQNPFANRSFWY